MKFDERKRDESGIEKDGSNGPEILYLLWNFRTIVLAKQKVLSDYIIHI